jgi:anti-anti-sigma regulatory factor
MFAGRRAADERVDVLKIRRSSNGLVVFTLSGQVDEEQVAELDALIKSERKGRHIVLDLMHLTLAGRDAVNFFKQCEAKNIQLRNCPIYIREWITRDPGQA